MTDLSIHTPQSTPVRNDHLKVMVDLIAAKFGVNQDILKMHREINHLDQDTENECIEKHKVYYDILSKYGELPEILKL